MLPWISDFHLSISTPLLSVIWAVFCSVSLAGTVEPSSPSSSQQEVVYARYNPATYYFAAERNVTLCYDFDCAERLINETRRDGSILVAYFSYIATEDTYLLEHLNWATDMLFLPGGKVSIRTLVLDHHKITAATADGGSLGSYSKQRSTEAISTYIDMLPPKTIFAIMNCYAYGVSFNIPHLPYIRNTLSKIDKLPQAGTKNVILHLGHEQPWSDPETNRGDHCYASSADELLGIYRNFDLVIRQYFYFPYNQYTEYLPLGAPYFGYSIPISDIDIKPTSQRSRKCFLSGRFIYKAPGVHELERNEIARLIFNEEFPCTVFSSKVNEDFVPKGSLGYVDYMSSMKDAQFAPCPSGGSAETYRLFEALEAGAIPVLVQQPSDRDFLSQWEGYPGPVLQSWSELKGYFDSLGVNVPASALSLIPERDEEGRQEVDIAGSDYNHDKYEQQQPKDHDAVDSITMEVNRRLDNLQNDIKVWYEAFKIKTKVRLNDKLFEVFRDVEQ